MISPTPDPYWDLRDRQARIRNRLLAAAVGTAIGLAIAWAFYL